MQLGILALIIIPPSAPATGREPSVCYGTTSNGRLENGWKLPIAGENFATHWTTGRILGRSFVHSAVHPVILDAYTELRKSMPDTVFVYGETGWKNGGQFKPHKTHRNGLSVDFMVPLLDEDGTSVPIPSNALNKWGYDLEFDLSGKLATLQIDAIAMAEHIFQLHAAARKHGIGIWRVIFDPELQPLLEASPRWPFLRDNVEFSTRRSWVRHDQHYHVDFEVECHPAT